MWRSLATAVMILTSSASAMGQEVGGGFERPAGNESAVHRHDGHTHSHPAAEAATAGMEVVLVASELVVGANRFAVGLFDEQGNHIQHAAVHLHYFDLRSPHAPVLESEADADALSTEDGLTTIYAHERDFAWPGPWGVEIQALLPDDRLAVRRIAFEVLPKGRSLAPGDRAPSLELVTAREVNGDLRKLSSAGRPHPELYEWSLDESLRSGKPTVILFATPAFCRTRLCGPSYDTVVDLQELHGGRANFIHIEIFAGMPNPAERNWQLAPAVEAFGLSTEPWLYIVGEDGVIVYRVEGMFTAAEVERHLLSVLAP